MAEIISKIVGYLGEITFDISKPDGAPRKLMDSSRSNALGWQPKTSLNSGLQIANQDFFRQLPPAEIQLPPAEIKGKTVTTESKVALIAGITGQDGSYLVELLLEKATPSMALSVGHLVLIHTALITYTKIHM